ncbi:hypothetical protein AAY473_002167 [Plecturocebus cupreus]
MKQQKQRCAGNESPLHRLLERLRHKNRLNLGGRSCSEPRLLHYTPAWATEQLCPEQTNNNAILMKKFIKLTSWYLVILECHASTKLSFFHIESKKMNVPVNLSNEGTAQERQTFLWWISGRSANEARDHKLVEDKTKLFQMEEHDHKIYHPHLFQGKGALEQFHQNLIQEHL